MQATDPVFYGGTLNGVLTLNGRIACSPTTGRKIDIYNDGSTIYGFGLNDFEYCVFGGQGSAFTYRIAKPGAVDLAGEVALFVDASGVGIPVGRPISWGSNTLLVDAAGALLVNGAPVGGGGSGGAGTFTSLTAPSLAASGAGTDANLALLSKGNGAVLAYGNNAVAFSMGAAAGAANYIAAFGAVAGSAPSFSAQGTDANVGIRFASKGTGQIQFAAGNTAAVTLANPANAVNAVAVTGAATGTAPTISAAGSDANVNLTLTGKGTGVVLIPAVDIEGGGIDNTTIGATTPSTLRGTTLALTGSLTAKFVFAAPNAAAGAPTWRQLLYTDLSGTIENVAIGGTTAAAGRFTTLTHTGFLLRSSATGLTASTTNTQAGALGLTASVNNITTAAANSAVRLPNAAPATNTAAEIIVRNGGANAVNVFPVSGAAINALAANAAYSLAAGASVRFMQLNSTLYVTA